MADLIQIDTDEEMDKYAEAELISQNPPPVAAIKEKTLNYNPITGRNDVLTSLSTGGYVKVGEEELPRIEQVQQYARTLKNIGVPFDIAEYEAAGFSAEEVQAAGVMPMVQEKPKRTEPLSEGEELRMRREGADMVAPLDQTLRQNTTNTLREIFVAAGLDNYQARQIAEGLIGNPNATRDLGIGIADFTPAGLFFGAQEGYRTFERGMNTGDPTTIGMGALEAGLSLLEAVPLTAAGAKAAKAGIPTLRQALVDLGQGAEARIAERGDTTLFSNPIEPAVDQALAMAGRAAGEAKPSAAELRRQANIQRFGYDPNEVVERPSTGDEGFEEYLKTVNPSGKRIAAEDRPNLMMGDMYGMLPRGSEVISTQDGVTFYRSQDGDYYATAFNPDVGEEDVVGYITDRGDGTELAVVKEMQGQGIGGELQYLFRKENPNAPTGGLTEAGERSLQRTYERLREEGIVNGATSAPIGLIDEKPKGIKAFHGSGVDFDKFDLSFMGTGEGAQAYGKGLYFAEMEDVAKQYRDQLSGHLNAKIGDQKVIDIYNDLSAQADRLPIEDAQIVYKKMAFLEDLELTSDINLSIDRIDDPKVEAWAKSEVLPKFQPAGNIYEVEIKADPSELLDFDAPISEQPAKVQEAIAPFVERRLDAIEAAGQEALKKAKELGRDFTPKTRSEILSTLKGGDILLLDKVETGEVSQALKDAGVPGIKYLDRQSRGKSFEIKLSVKDKPYATEPIFATNKADAERIANDYKEKGFGVTITDVGSNNYVVLDDNLIEIVKKYGFGGLMVGAGVQSGLGVKESFEEI